MVIRRTWIITATCLTVAAGSVVAGGPVAAKAPPEHHANCSSGAHTLSHHGDHVYPETGNGGYRSLHTDVHMIYNAVTNKFLRGNHVSLTDRATKCLKNFSLDFERTSPDGKAGPDMKVRSVSVNGHSAKFTFVQPTYPGDPNGQNDPDPRAHQAGQHARVGGPDNNPLPPACEPELTGNKPGAQDGTACPANKLVITPAHPIKNGARFVVTVHYTGRPGVHLDGDGSTEGWFRSDSPHGDGGFVTTEPVGTEDWMPLNDHPSAKATYDFYDRVTAGRTAIANGILKWKHHHGPTANFAHGSTTWHWHMGSPTASYLVENSVGAFDLTKHRSGGRVFYEAQASSLSKARKRANLAVMKQQADITRFQSRFNGPFPFASDGVLVGKPSASFEEEMETMITFAGGEIDLDTFNHENMHQWWGDNVTESNYNMTFFKEGLATLGEFLFGARTAEKKSGHAAFEKSLVAQFNSNYAQKGSFWRNAPSNPTAYNLFSGSSTYARPGTAYLALREILGHKRFKLALQHFQKHYGGGTINERQLEAGFAHWLPNRSTSCQTKLGRFFTQWFDTAYPTKSGATKPHITGPGLDGGGFYNGHDGCS
jgi:hypothetical protein